MNLCLFFSRIGLGAKPAFSGDYLQSMRGNCVIKEISLDLAAAIELNFYFAFVGTRVQVGT